MFNTMKKMIQSKNFALEDMKERLKNLTAHGDLTPEQRSELERLAMENADALNETNKSKMLADHEARIRALEDRVKQLLGDGGETEDGGESGAVALKEPYDPHKWYYTGDGCSWNGKNYTCKDSPASHPCTWSPDANPNRWELDAVQPE